MTATQEEGRRSAAPSTVDGRNVYAVGWVSGFDLKRLADDHPTAYLRGTVELAVSAPEIAGSVADPVVVVGEAHYANLVADNTRMADELDRLTSAIQRASDELKDAGIGEEVELAESVWLLRRQRDSARRRGVDQRDGRTRPTDLDADGERTERGGT